MKSVPADQIVFDELDEATPEAKAMAKERLSHSAYKRIIELSNPSLPDFGIDEAYQVSDQRHWTVRCPGCATWTALDKEICTMGVDTGRALHVVILQPIDGEGDVERQQLVHLAV